MDAAAASAGPAGRAGRKRRLWRAILRNRKASVGLALFLLFCAAAAFPHLFVPWSHGDPQAVGQFGSELHPSLKHWLGTTQLGQDVYTQLIYGTRESLLIALIAGAGATVLSVVIGVSAAYLGGISDDVLSMFTGVFLVLPAFPLMIVLATYAKGSLVLMIAVLVATGWAYGANQLRAQGLSLRNRDFLESARVRGERRSYIIGAEILPTMTSLILATFLGSALYAVLTAAGLQFLGLGDSSSLSWGTMLYWAQNQSALLSGFPAWALAPGFAVALLGVSFALLNYAFDEISNPALRPVRRHRGKRADS
jgi:peptide/nickel transport system permease protein